MTTIVEDDRYLYLPEGFEAPPTTAVEALQQGRAILMEEGRWIQREMYHNPRPEEDPDTPFCNGWGACAIGAVAICTLGMHRCDCPSPDPHWQEPDTTEEWPRSDIFHEAEEALDEAAGELTDGLHDTIIGFNDRSVATHAAVIEAFDRAIADLSDDDEAEEVPSP